MKEEWIVDISETNNEIWFAEIECASRKDAIEEGMAYAKKEGLKSFRIGEKEPVTPSLDIETILESVSECVYDEVGEVAESYLDDVTTEQQEELEEKLNNVFQSWLDKHGLNPSFYKIINDEVIEVK